MDNPFDGTSARSDEVMIIAAPEPKARLQPVGEQRVAFWGLSWEAYLTLLATLPQGRGSRLMYDDGLLEITVPLEDHAFAARLIERFIINKFKTCRNLCQSPQPAH